MAQQHPSKLFAVELPTQSGSWVPLVDSRIAVELEQSGYGVVDFEPAKTLENEKDAVVEAARAWLREQHRGFAPSARVDAGARRLHEALTSYDQALANTPGGGV